MSISNEPCENSLLKLYDFMMFEGLIVTKSYARSQARENVRAFRLAWAAACAFRKLQPSTIENEERRGKKEGIKRKECAFERNERFSSRFVECRERSIHTKWKTRKSSRWFTPHFEIFCAERSTLRAYTCADTRIYERREEGKRGRKLASTMRLKKNFVEAIGREISYTRV